jgi:hypothetical protein
VCRLLELIVLVGRSDRAKELEILVLRHELSILRRQVNRPRFQPHDRLLLAAFSRVLPRRSWHAFFVQPETLLYWHRRLVARRWIDPHRPPGRPPISPGVRELTLRLARENPNWGYLRIVGELRKLGVAVSATSVRTILGKAGLAPAQRRHSQSWRSFLQAHADSILACDFFTVDTVWLLRLYVLVFLSIGSRRIAYVACTRKPNTAWMLQQTRNRSIGSVPPRVPRPAPDRRSPPARARPPRLRQSPQLRATSPRPRPKTAKRERSFTRASELDLADSSGESPRPARRPHPRVRTRRSMTIEFCTSRGGEGARRRWAGAPT